MARRETTTGTTWLDQRHPDYVENAPRWRYSRDHYEGCVVDQVKVVTYLVRKASAESETMFLERCMLADYTPHFSTVVDALAGMLFAVEGDATRFLGDDEKPGLGDPEDEKSAMYRLWRDCDGQNTGWITFFKQLAIELIHQHRAWILVDQKKDMAMVRLWPASSVVNWKFVDDVLSEVLITEYVDARAGIKDKGKVEQQWVLYTLRGWERWRKDDGGQPQLVTGEAWGTPFANEQGDAILPIFPVQLPLKRNVGYMLARKANAIFNKESERDTLLRSGGFPLLLLAAGDTQYKSLITELKKGVRALQDDPKITKSHAFIAPDTGSAAAQTETLNRKVEEFYITGFREYGNAAREKTATEVGQDVAAGVGAFLQMLKAAIDDAENQTMQRVAQIEYPQDQGRWFNNSIERSETFVPTDIQNVIKGMKERYLATDQPMPLGPKGMLSLAKQCAQYDGIEFDENEMKASILISEMTRMTEIFDKLPVPAEVKVDMTMELMIALGYVNAEEQKKIDDENANRSIEEMRSAMMDLALADEQAKKLMAQPLDMGSGAPVPNRLPAGPKAKPSQES